MVIFFDIDGTLVDQRTAETLAARRFLERFGAQLPQHRSVEEFCDDWRLLREKHLPAFLNQQISYDEYHRRRIRELFAAELSDQQADERFNVFLQEYRRSWRLFDDVRDCLDELSHLQLGVLSNGNSRLQRQKLEATGVLDRFSLVLVSEEVGAAKPSGRFFHAACERAGCRPEQCVYVGDRLEADAIGSCRVGMRGIWLDRTRTAPASSIEAISSLLELSSRLRYNGHVFTPDYPTEVPDPKILPRNS